MLHTADTPLGPAWATQHPALTEYYLTEWGLPVTNDAGVFEQLVLEGFQSGLSWLTILKKREAFRAAFASFEPESVAAFGDADLVRLMNDDGIIRNHRKILAAVQNARATVQMQRSGTGLAELVWSYRPLTTPLPEPGAPLRSSSPESQLLAAELKRRGFMFVGPVTVFALMAAIGVIDAHPVGSARRGSSGLWYPDGSLKSHPVFVSPRDRACGAAA